MAHGGDGDFCVGRITRRDSHRRAHPLRDVAGWCLLSVCGPVASGISLTPSGSLLFLGFVASVLALTGTFEELYSLFVFSLWIFFALTSIALLRLRRKAPELARPYRVWGYPWTPLIFLIAAIALTVNLWMVRPVRSSLGLIVILAGIPFFYQWRRDSTRASPTCERLAKSNPAAREWRPEWAAWRRQFGDCLTRSGVRATASFPDGSFCARLDSFIFLLSSRLHSRFEA